MEFLVASVAWSLQSLNPYCILKHLGIASSLCSLPWSNLAEKLSSQASIVQRGDPEFFQLASRWTEWNAPDVQAVVTVFSENDVAETIKYANAHNVPFLAFSSGHGMSENLAQAKDIILINLRKMEDIKLSKDRQSATIGPGTRVKKIITDLWAEGKQTVTGVCECVSISGPALGGGHGWLQGQYGLAIDQVLSARLVTPDGVAITVSQDINPDLFWAVRGAGHNFGIVTEWNYKLHDVKTPKWPWQIFVYPGSKLEELMDVANLMIQTQGPEVTHWMYYLMVPEVDPDNAVLWMGLSTDGPVDQISAFSKMLHAMDPIMFKNGEASLPDLASETFMGENDMGCQKGNSAQFYPTRVREYNKKSARKAFDLFDATLKRVPELRKSMLLLEGYSNHGVQAVTSDSTAYPHREHTILISASPIYKPNLTTDLIARDFSEELRKIILHGSDDPSHLHAYVNYAYGNEQVEALYGWEPWRLQRLKALKAKWDPNNRMRFYAPIV